MIEVAHPQVKFNIESDFQLGFRGCCTKGDECRYCHESHPKRTGKLRPRTRKLTREMLKEHVAASIADLDRHEKWNEAARRHFYARQLIWNILDTNSQAPMVFSLEL
eukprot:s2236_g15.t1